MISSSCVKCLFIVCGEYVVHTMYIVFKCVPLNDTDIVSIAVQSDARSEPCIALCNSFGYSINTTPDSIVRDSQDNPHNKVQSVHE